MDRNSLSPDEASWLKDRVKAALQLPDDFPVAVITPEIDVTVVGPAPDAIESEHVRNG